MKVGIVGVGFMGTTHAAGWRAIPEVEIVGLVAETEAEAAPLAAELGCRVFPTLAAILPLVDVIDICTPTDLHKPMTLQAAASGKHVVCEKPLARTTADAQAMLAACQAAGVQLLVGQVVRFFPEYAAAQAAVAAGKIGQVGVVRLTRGSYRPKKAAGNWFLDEAKSGGILMDLMIHDFDYARWIAGEVTTVSARRVSQQHPEAPIDYGLAILTHRSGALSHITGGWAYPPPTFRTGLEIAGDRGLIEFASDASAPITTLIQTPGRDAPDVALPSSPVSESPYTTQIKAFYAALAHGAPLRVRAEDGLAAVQIAEAAIESARRGRPVSLQPLPELAAAEVRP